MARTSKNVVYLADSTAVDATTTGYATTIDATLVTNGITVPNYASKDGNVWVRVKNTAVADKTFTVKKGTYPRAFADKVVTVPATSGDQILLIKDSARYKQADGSIQIDFASGFTGTIEIYGVK